ncbi:MAG: lipid A export permease/ATP-binding protein MsbA [Pseudomonadales bacterium]
MSDANKKSDLTLYRRVLKYAQPYWPVFVLALLGYALGNAAEVYLARMLADFMDQWDQPARLAESFVISTVLAAALLRGMGAVTGEVFLSRVSFRVIHDIRTELFRSLLRKSTAFFDQATTGRLVSIFSFSVLQMRDTATDALKTIIQDGSKVVLLLAGMLYTSWALSLVFFISIPFVAAVTYLASSRFRRISERIQSSMGEVTHVASEAIEAHAVVRSFDGYGQENKRFVEASDTNRRRLVRLAMTKAGSVQIIQFIVASALAGLMYLLLQPAIGEQLSTGDVLFFLSLAGLIAKPVKKLSEVNAKLQRGLAAAEEVFSTLDNPGEHDNGTLEAKNSVGRIDFSEVTFSYGADQRPIIDRISFSVEPGETVAIVGRTGSGKSTILSLLPRLYEPDTGVIKLDGVDVRDLSLKSLRDQIAVVAQNVQLFNTSIRENITYGNGGQVGSDEMQRVIDGAGLAEFVARLPDGLETLIGDRGTRLSGGERQRIALARALLKEKPILILDEATSALDQETERIVQLALSNPSTPRTTLIVAHRLETVKSADRIIVFDSGKIIESGTHEELLKKQGFYSKLSQSELIKVD